MIIVKAQFSSHARNKYENKRKGLTVKTVLTKTFTLLNTTLSLAFTSDARIGSDQVEEIIFHNEYGLEAKQAQAQDQKTSN